MIEQTAIEARAERARKYQRDWKRQHYARDRETLLQRVRERRAKFCNEINARRRERAAEKHEQERAVAWRSYQECPPEPGLPPGQQLRLWLDAKGWNMRRLAREIGVSARSVFDWLRSKHPPDRPKRLRLYEITGLQCFHTRLREKRPRYDEEIKIAPALLEELAVTCGLSSREIRRLQVSQIENKGVHMPGGRLIRFGNKWHEVEESLVRRWLSIAQPKSFVFFQHKPVDRGRPVAAQWITRNLTRAGISIRPQQSVRVQHFETDAKRFGAGPRLLKHLRKFHGLSKTHARATWKKCILARKPNRKRGAPAGLRQETRARIIVAADCQRRWMNHYGMASTVYPRQNRRMVAYKNTNRFFHNFGPQIEKEKARLADLPEDERVLAVNNAKSFLILS